MTVSNDKEPARTASAKEIAAELRDAITEGRLKPGDKLPSERELAAEYGAARNTARDAVRFLIVEGLVQSQQGRGSFVRTAPKWMRFGRRRYSRDMRTFDGLGPFGAEAAAQGKRPRVDVPSIERTKPPAEVAERLQIDTETDVVRRENWYHADDEPVQVGVTYAPWSIVEGTPLSNSADLGPKGIYGQFEDRGYVIDYIREEIAARMPTREEASRLRIPDGVPVIDLWHTGFDAERRPFETTRFVMRADYSALDYDMRVED